MSEEELSPPGYPGFARALHALGGNWHFNTEPLAGKTLAGVKVSDDKTILTFDFENGESVSYSAEGDCCSNSWIEHITVPPDVAGSEITAWADQPMGSFNKDWETIQVYQTSFLTAKGEIIVEYRNSSNGYYGGWLQGPI